MALARHAPLVVGCTDKTYQVDGKHIQFPPFPWVVPYIIKWLFEGRHSGAWVFNPCDAFGNPRERPYASVKGNLSTEQDSTVPRSSSIHGR